MSNFSAATRFVIEREGEKALDNQSEMGIDLKSGGRRKGHNVRKAPVSKNVYLKLLEKLYRYSLKAIIFYLKQF